MTDYGNDGSERGLPGDVAPEDVERIVGQSGGVPLYATRSYKAIERAQAQERSDRTPRDRVPETVCPRPAIQAECTYPECDCPVAYMPLDQALDSLSDRTSVRLSIDEDTICDCGLDNKAALAPGPHHSDRCPLHELPDYGVFGPDD